MGLNLQTKNTIIIAAGGTGGHIFPALAIIKELEQYNYHIIWVGNSNGMEAKIANEHNIEFIAININGIRKKNIRYMIIAVYKILFALLRSFIIIKQCKPKLIMSFGGYVSFPISVMAKVWRLPLVIHEQNAVAGLTNKILNKIANKTLTAFDKVLPHAIVVGNPIRKEILEFKHSKSIMSNQVDKSNGNKLNILIVGGSLGASIFNEQLPYVFRALIDIGYNNIGSITHQVGNKHKHLAQNLYHSLNLTKQMSVNIVNFIDNMAEAYYSADLVICRSGALTVSEICICAKACIFIPYPFAVDNHQLKNAQLVANHGGALIVNQQDFTINVMRDMIKKLTKIECLTMGKLNNELAINDSHKQITNIINQIAQISINHNGTNLRVKN